MTYLIRAVQADEWPRVKELRLSALADPVAPLAFITTLEQGAAQPDAFWQESTEAASRGTAVRQFIAEDPEGSWAGTVVVLVERPGNDDFFGQPILAPQAQLVGVFVRAEHRGSGLAEQLFEAGVAWAWSLRAPAVGRVRLFVHAANERAAAFYRRFGFTATGLAVGEDQEMQITRP
ncbi:GNAT family N-acetyltransferase [Streptomyces sp. NBC_01477]|uniref:GNAT family N-acetyltransferase n=1 Tax=Streptomyces sp. NBC_01477 TaxID=2976015 RepID=UPI002E34EFF5|nr:GNAT family N-acetyltransferase [Streptomyces sp. NBC_01477]